MYFSSENVCNVVKTDAIHTVIKILLKNKRNPATNGFLVRKNKQIVNENIIIQILIADPFANFDPMPININEPIIAPTKLALVTSEYPVPVNPSVKTNCQF